MIHVKLRDSRKTTWFIKNSLFTFSLKEISPIFGYISYSNTIDIHEKHDLSWEILGKLGDSWKPKVSAPLLEEVSFLVWSFYFSPLLEEVSFLVWSFYFWFDLHVVLEWF